MKTPINSVLIVWMSVLITGCTTVGDPRIYQDWQRQVNSIYSMSTPKGNIGRPSYRPSKPQNQRVYLPPKVQVPQQQAQPLYLRPEEQTYIASHYGW